MEIGWPVDPYWTPRAQEDVINAAGVEGGQPRRIAREGHPHLLEPVNRRRRLRRAAFPRGDQRALDPGVIAEHIKDAGDFVEFGFEPLIVLIAAELPDDWLQFAGHAVHHEGRPRRGGAGGRAHAIDVGLRWASPRCVMPSA